jgi:uncharacterized protein YndB with AHSA1/START domain
MSPQFTIHTQCKAPPEQVYALLTDLKSHLAFNGSDQAPNYRLLTLESEPGAATAGTIFSSAGSIPFTSRRWADVSTVTEAVPPRVFAFRTEGTVAFQDGTAMQAKLQHHYVLTATAEGCRIDYTLEQIRLEHGMWRLTLPVMGSMMWRFGIPMMAKRGVRALAKRAETAARRAEAIATA